MADQGNVGFSGQLFGQIQNPGTLGEYWGGQSISGTVTINEAPGRRRVLLIHRQSRRVILETLSDLSTGAYSFAGLSSAHKYLALGLDETGQNAVVADHITPG